MADQATTTRSGLSLEEIPDEEFRVFAMRFANSPEVGPIRTCLDSDAARAEDAEHLVVGLRGCEALCAAAAFQFFRSGQDPGAWVVKLDSIIVDHRLRRRGLGGVLVAHYFGKLVKDNARKISRIYAHSVHPATLRMLKRLGFNDPPPAGAPITDLGVDPETGDRFARACAHQIASHTAFMRVHCELCRTNNRRARPWCQPHYRLR